MIRTFLVALLSGSMASTTGVQLLAGAELLPGESLGTEWLSASSIDVGFEQGQLQFSGDANGGGTVVIAATPGGGKRLVVEETTGGKAGATPSVFHLALAKESPLVKRLNALLSRSAGQPPVSFTFSLSSERLAASNRALRYAIELNVEGRKRPLSNFFIGDTDPRRLSAWQVGGGRVTLDDTVIPAFRFQVPATGGASEIDGLRLSINLRVGDDGTPERWAIDDMALHELTGPPLVGKIGVLACVGSAPAPALLAAARAADWTVRPTETGFMAGADCYLVDRRCDDEDTAKFLNAALDAGSAVLLCATGDAVHPALAARLPTNPWSWASLTLKRDDASVRPIAGGLFAGITKPLAVNSRYDLHLPGAPIENLLLRYQWEEHAKSPLVSDWRVELACADDATLPMLICGRSGPGRAAVLGSSFSDRALCSAPGYPAFSAALLNWGARQSTAAPAAFPDQLRLAVAPRQSEGLAIVVSNPGREPASAVLSWKTCSWGREHLLARSQVVLVPGGGSLTVPLVDDTPSTALPWRRIDAALLDLGRTKVLQRILAPVCVEGAVAIDCEEDPAGYADLDKWANTSADTWCDGRIALRTVYRPGQIAALTLRLRNGRMDLAPLATARDTQQKENPTVGGLNDLSWSTSSVRGKGPWQGAWSGRPAATQRIELAWPTSVTVIGHRITGWGSHRNWERSNPVHHTLLGMGDGKPVGLAHQDAATFLARRGDVIAYHEAMFAAPSVVNICALAVEGLDPKANLEPKHQDQSNCSILEWEVFGWPAATPPPPADDTLIVTLVDVRNGMKHELVRERIALPAFAEAMRTVRVPCGAGLGLWRLEARYGGAQVTHEGIVVPAGGKELVAKEALRDHEEGLLCSPGWVNTLGFGVGMRSQTAGWGGDDDQIWALTHGQMEMSAESRDAADRLFTTATKFSHYTNPWRMTPGGWYGWDIAADAVLAKADSKGWKRVHIFGADRWNGILVGKTWGWSEFIAFDRHLRTTTGKGLSGRSRGQLADEIKSSHGDEWQRWQMNSYADALLATRARYAKAGHEFTFESHGSFPLCGGDIGAKLASTHIGTGTDLFWELRNQDLWWSLGTRFGVVAANPDLQSGAYAQWGWDNSIGNQWWFANSGGQDTARRQWYATYFAGRIDLSGTFQPYHMMGWNSQGNVGTRMYSDDFQAWNSVAQVMCQVRPESAAGVGIAVSWGLQEHRMGSELDRGGGGFGLFTAKGQEQIDMLMGHVYHRLARNGLPIAWVTSSQALKAWKGTQPLVMVDGFSWSPLELAEVERLNRAGTPLLCIGAASLEADTTSAAQLFGTRRSGTQWLPGEGSGSISLPDGRTCITTHRSGRGPTIWCPAAPSELGVREAAIAAHAFLAACGEPLRLPAGVTCSPFISRGAVWLPLCEQGDAPHEIEVTVKPEALMSGLGANPMVIDIDSGQAIPSKRLAEGTLGFTVNLPGSGGRMLCLMPGAKP